VDGQTALKELKHVLYESDYDGAWTEPLLISYLSEGQDRFCEDTGVIIDPVSYAFDTVVDQASYALGPRVIRVLDVHINGRPLIQYDAKHGNIVRHSGPSEGAQPTYFRTDWAPGYITLTPVPQDVFHVELRVWRYAKCSFEDREEFEIPSQFHRACIEYAAYKALSHHDMELQDPIKAKDHYANYTMYVARAKEWLHQLRGAQYETVPNQQYVV
jgi:hypothetical protein